MRKGTDGHHRCKISRIVNPTNVVYPNLAIHILHHSAQFTPVFLSPIFNTRPPVQSFSRWPLIHVTFNLYWSSLHFTIQFITFLNGRPDLHYPLFGNCCYGLPNIRFMRQYKCKKTLPVTTGKVNRPCSSVIDLSIPDSSFQPQTHFLSNSILDAGFPSCVSKIPEKGEQRTYDFPKAMVAPDAINRKITNIALSV